MSFILSSDTSFCMTPGGTVLLDLGSGRYCGLPFTSELPFERAAAGEVLTDSDQRSLAPLVDAGLIVTSDSDRMPWPSGRRSVFPSDSYNGAGLSAPLLSVARASGFLLQSGYRTKFWSIRQIVRQIAAKKKYLSVPSAVGDVQAAGPIVGAHALLDRFISPHDRCLMRSLALTGHLASVGVSPDLIIGVRTSPFAAHCWVQLGNVLLNDEIDRVRLFTPILVL